MSRFEIDTRTLKQPLLILAGVVVLAALLLYAVHDYKQARLNARQQAQADLAMARDTYRQTVEAYGILKTSQQRYLHLQQRRFVGAEPRLLWVESLRESGREQNLYNLQYNLHQRQEARFSDTEPLEHYQLYSSAMQLHLELAHEVDLLRYFADLEQHQPAVYQVRGCTLKPLFTEARVSLHAANVSVKCDVRWYTLDKPAEDPVAGGIL